MTLASGISSGNSQRCARWIARHPPGSEQVEIILAKQCSPCAGVCKQRCQVYFLIDLTCYLLISRQQEDRFSHTVPQSPLSKAVNTEFPRHQSSLGPRFVKTPVVDAKAPILEIEESERDAMVSRTQTANKNR